MEASFTGILERNGISRWINQRNIYFHSFLGIKWHMQTGGNVVLSGQQNQQNVPAGRVIKVVPARLSWTMPCGFFNGVYEPMDLDLNIGKDNEIFSSH